MPIVIKEIQVHTVVEKKVVVSEQVSPELYERLKEEIAEELSADKGPRISIKAKRER